MFIRINTQIHVTIKITETVVSSVNQVYPRSSKSEILKTYNYKNITVCFIING